MMATWQFTMEFIDRRVCTIGADTEEEAQEKMDSGDWASEDTIDFFANDLIKPLEGVD